MTKLPGTRTAMLVIFASLLAHSTHVHARGIGSSPTSAGAKPGHHFKTRYPKWITRIVKPGRRYSDRKLMELAIKVSDANARHGGGPFGAIVATRSGRVVSIGNNKVVPTHDPTAHAEVTAIRRAGKEKGNFRLSKMKLFTSAAPCIMCTGAIHWAGLEKVYAGARKADVERIGFVEGPQSFEPSQFFKERGIKYQPDVQRQQAVRVLQGYAQRQGNIYNGAE